MSSHYLVVERAPNATSMDLAVEAATLWYKGGPPRDVYVYELRRVIHFATETNIEEVTERWTAPEQPASLPLFHASPKPEEHTQSKSAAPDNSPSASKRALHPNLHPCPNCGAMECDCLISEQVMAHTNRAKKRPARRREKKPETGGATSSKQ